MCLSPVAACAASVPSTGPRPHAYAVSARSGPHACRAGPRCARTARRHRPNPPRHPATRSESPRPCWHDLTQVVLDPCLVDLDDLAHSRYTLAHGGGLLSVFGTSQSQTRLRPPPPSIVRKKRYATSSFRVRYGRASEDVPEARV